MDNTWAQVIVRRIEMKVIGFSLVFVSVFMFLVYFRQQGPV